MMRVSRKRLNLSPVDSTIALMIAFFINAAILILAASTFYVSGHTEVAEIGQAYKLLSPLLNVPFRKYTICFSSLSIWSKLHRDRDLSRTNRHGGISKYSHETLGAKAIDKRSCPYPSHFLCHFLWGKRYCKATDLEPSYFKHPIRIRCYPSYFVHQRSEKNGKICKFPRDKNSGMDMRRNHYYSKFKICF